MNLTIRPMTKPEQMYCYTQSTQIMGQTGCIGHLRADMDTDGNGFFSTWEDHRSYLKTGAFKAELDDVINQLRFGPGDLNGVRHPNEDTFLADRGTLGKYCWSQPSAKIEGMDESYGFRVDTEGYTYMMRLSPIKGVYNLYCYCYRRDWLDQHLKNAERGIRFIDTNYNNKFRLPDGGRICITYSDGEVSEKVCRYIDEYHAEIGYGSCNLYHICEFAERMEKAGAHVQPLDQMPEIQKQKRSRER